MNVAIHQSVSPSGATLYRPRNSPPRGGVVCLHGSDGGFSGWNHVNCALLAANGFVALANSYSRQGRFGRTPDIDGAPLDGTEAALVFLKRDLAPYRCGVGLFGYLRGAEHVLLLAQLLAEDGSPAVPRAVAAHSPQDAVWPAFILSDFETGQPWAGDQNRPAWTWRGGAGRTAPGTPLGVAPSPYPVLITQGTEDEVWSAESARDLVNRMTAAGTPPEAHVFEGEPHIFRAEARNRQWELTIDFFGRHLATEDGEVLDAAGPVDLGGGAPSSPDA